MTKKAAKRFQFNMRIDPQLVEAIDRKAAELEKQFGQVLTRSDIIRMAVAKFVNESPASAPN